MNPHFGQKYQLFHLVFILKIFMVKSQNRGSRCKLNHLNERFDINKMEIGLRLGSIRKEEDVLFLPNAA